MRRVGEDHFKEYQIHGNHRNGTRGGLSFLGSVKDGTRKIAVAKMRKDSSLNEYEVRQEEAWSELNKHAAALFPDYPDPLVRFFDDLIAADDLVKHLNFLARDPRYLYVVSDADPVLTRVWVRDMSEPQIEAQRALALKRRTWTMLLRDLPPRRRLFLAHRMILEPKSAPM